MRRTCWGLASAAHLLLLAGCSPDPARSAAEDPRDVIERSAALTAAQAALARWSSLVSLPLVPVSAANLPDGKVLLWSAEDRFGFGSDGGRTYTALFDPATGSVSEQLVSVTGHDMFCPGTANLPDGRILVNGGLSSAKTSIYDPASRTWSTAAAMNIPRGYQGTTPLLDGSVLTLGGSWSGGVGNKHGEIWTAAAGWRRLSGVPIDPFLSVDPTRNFGGDSHLWLLQVGNGRVFHVGPGVNMNWIDTEGNGRVLAIGRRGDDEFSINGGAVLYDTGRILKMGGAPGYEGINANAKSYVIEVGAGVTVRAVQPMAYRRAFHNAVPLPNGQVVVIGGATVAVGFTDNNAVLAPEIFDPATETFVALPPMSVARNYHSIALLLPDGRVLSGGGGLCGSGCAANHPDLQILSPPYLFNADGTPAARPAILSAPAQANHGTAMTVSTDSAIASFALVRLSSTTHAVNNDQRRLSLTSRPSGANVYSVDVPRNPGWALPGLYMLFALNDRGVPSIARTIRIGADTPLRLRPIEDQGTAQGAETALPLQAMGASTAPLTYAATGLPPGLTIDAGSGVIAGAATAPGRYLVEASVSDGQQTVSTQFTWSVTDPGTTRFVLLEARSEVNGNPWSSAAEINLLDESGQPLPRGAWTATADSAETAGEDGAAANAIDGSPATIWHTQWQATSPPPPHWLKIDLGGAFRLSGLRYLPRQDGSANGTLAQYRVYVSADGVNWGAPVSDDNFSLLGPTAEEKTIYFANVARGKTAVQSSTASGGTAARAVDGNRDGVFANGSVSHTGADANAFWEVDLGASHQIYGARLFNRTDCCADRASNFYVLASDAPMLGRPLSALLSDPAVAGVQVPGALPATRLFTLPARARYVRVQLAGTNNLHLAEVEVYGRLAANRPPALMQPVAPDARVGAPITLALQASDPDGDPLTYAAAGLPPGLTLDAGTGVVSGAATAAGSYPVDVSVSDGRGGSASARFTWFIGLSPPVISPIAAPQVQDGQRVSYSASATGGGALEYQWDFGDGTGDSGFSASPDVTHTFPRPGVYLVTLTVRNADGSASSIQFLQAVSAPAIPGHPAASANLAVEPRGGAGARLWVVNQDNDTVSVFDTASGARLKEIAVGAQPRSVALGPDGRVWVANKGAGTLSVLDPGGLTVTQTVGLPRGSQPFGVVLGADGSVYVALEGAGRVLKLGGTGAVLHSLDVGAAPRHLALTAPGDRLLVSRFITPFQPGEATAAVQATVGGVKQGGEVVVIHPGTMTLQRTIRLQHSDKPDSTVSGRGVPNYLGAPAISPDGQSAWVPSKQDNIGRGLLRDMRDLDFQNTVRAITSRIDLISEAEDHAARIDHDNSGVASAALYHPGGAYLFVALEASRQVSVVDAYGERELFRVDAGRAPQALQVAPDGRTLYVHNFMDRSVGVYDLRPLLDRGEIAVPLTATWSSVAAERLSSQVLRGKQLFYDARDTRLARDAYLSCASCHNDGGHDGRTWDLSGFGEGLRNTISLRGRGGGQGRLHWSANFDEVQDFEGQIRGLAQGTGLMSDAQLAAGTRGQPLGDPKAGVSADLDALSSYVGSLAGFAQTPHRTAAGALTAEALAGRAVFAERCATCHGGDGYTDSATLALHDVGTLKPTSGQRLSGPLTGIDTPTLRDVWATAPYLHDGSAATVESAIQAHTNLSLSAAELASVAAFTRQIGAEEPAVAPSGGGLAALYYPNNSLSGSAVLTRIEGVDFDWGASAPAAGLPADNFSVRWEGKVQAPSTGSYRFQTLSDDGVRVWVNGARIINNWTAHSPTTNTSSSVSLVAGQRYDIKVEYQERTGGAVMQLRWRPPGAASYAAIPAGQLHPAGVGLTGRYFSNSGLSGTPVLTRIEAVNFSWGTGAPASGVPADNFSVRWTGLLTAPATGTYRLQTSSDDGVRVWLNGTSVINNWTAHSLTTDTGPAVSLTAGQRYNITVEYYALGGSATMRLLWLTPGAGSYVAIPASQLNGN